MAKCKICGKGYFCDNEDMGYPPEEQDCDSCRCDRCKEHFCRLCERDGVETTLHHFIPKQKNTDGRKVRICVGCHKQLHALFTNNELKHDFDSLEAMKADEKVMKFVAWIKKKPAESHVRARQSHA